MLLNVIMVAIFRIEGIEGIEEIAEIAEIADTCIQTENAVRFHVLPVQDEKSKGYFRYFHFLKVASLKVRPCADLFRGRVLLLALASLYIQFDVAWLSYDLLVPRVLSNVDRTILYLRKHLLGLQTHRIIPARGRCVVVAIARKCDATTTSNVFCRNIDNSGNGEGEPFQLRKLENRSFWKNEEVTNEGLKVGCLLKYGDGTYRQRI